MLGFRLRAVFGAVHSGGNVSFGCGASEERVLYSCSGGRVGFVDVSSQKSGCFPFEARVDVRLVCCAPSGALLAAFDASGAALFFSSTKRTVIARLKFPSSVTCAAFSPDSKVLFVAQGRKGEIWSTPSNKTRLSALELRSKVQGHKSIIRSCTWTPDSRGIVTAGDDMTLLVHRLSGRRTQRTRAILAGHREAVVSCLFVENAGKIEGLGRGFDDAVTVAGDAVYSVAKDAAVFIWAADEGAEGESWRPVRRMFVRKTGGDVYSAEFRRRMLVIGYSHGVFGLFRMPTGELLHALSITQAAITSVRIGAAGDWLAIACAPQNQLIIWEWESETHVLKQEGLSARVVCVKFSPTGRFMATGSEDGRLKLWDATSGFCQSSFSDHEGSVTAVDFVGNGGKAVVSASTDATVRAYDLIRFKHFRTMVPPRKNQLLSVAVDAGGEVVVAGGLDPYEVYVWSLQTGRLTDVLSGHEGPISALSFGNTASETLLASGSWDGTCRLWDVYKSNLLETIEHPADVLDISFAPGGDMIATTCLAGTMHVWDVTDAVELKIVEVKRDARAGERMGESLSRDNELGNAHFSSIAFSADGACLFCGGDSKFACIYEWRTGILLKKFQISHNRNVQGVLDTLRRDADGEVVQEDTSESIAHTAPLRRAHGDDGSRKPLPKAAVTSISCAPSGREFAVASHEGVLVYSLDEDTTFEPFLLDEDITESSVRESLKEEDFAKAIAMALQLDSDALVREAIESVPVDHLTLICAHLPSFCIPKLLHKLAELLRRSRHLEYHLRFLNALYAAKAEYMGANALRLRPQLRLAQKALQQHVDELVKHMDRSAYTLTWLAGPR